MTQGQAEQADRAGLLGYGCLALLTLGGFLAGGWPLEGRLGVVGRAGLGDWLSADLQLAGSLDADGVSGLADVGFIAAWDVLIWVPELRIAGGIRFDPHGADIRLAASLGARRYLSLASSLLLAAGVEWSNGDWLALLSIGFDFGFE